MIIVKFAPELRPILKHASHEQQSHGNWARYAMADRFERPYGYDNLNVRANELPKTLYHVSSSKNEQSILESGLRASDENTWNTGAGLTGKWEDNWVWGKDDEGEWQQEEYRPTGVYVFGNLEQAERYAQKGDNIYAIDTETTMSFGSDVIRDPSVAGNWYELIPEEDYAWVLNEVPTRAISLQVKKHAEHDQSSHGNWASGELSDDQIRNVVYNSKTVNEMYQEIARLQGKSMKPKVAELSEDEVNLYRGVANPERDTAQLLEGKIPFTELQTWGQGIYTTPDKGEASSYGQVVGIKLDKSAKLVQGELAWDKSFQVKFTDTGIESDWFDFSRTLEQIKRGEKDNFSVSDLRNLYWAGKGYDGFQPFDRETVLFNADKLTINSRDIKGGITKHAEHDQSSHGNWASGGSQRGANIDENAMYAAYEKAGLTVEKIGRTSNERQAFESYLEAGHFINQRIRKTFPENLNEKFTAINQQTYPANLVRDIDNLIDSAPNLKGDRLYRLTSSETVERLKIGDVIKDRAYTSTTAADVTNPDNGILLLTLARVSSGRKSIITIDGNQNQKGLFMPAINKNNPIAFFEREVVLPRDTKLEYKGVSEVRGFIVFNFERLP